MAPIELSQITVLNRKQGYIRGQVTRLKTVLQEEELLADDADILQKLQTIEKLRTKLEDLRNESYCSLSDAELPDLEASLDELQFDLEKCEVSFQKLLKPSSISSVKNDQSSGNCKLKLPSINLPVFSGSYVEWLSFKTQFISLIDENDQLSEQQKLFYLQSALKGNAKQLITVNDTYSSLFEALKKRFENTRLLIMSHINEIFNCSKVKCESGTNLRQMLDKIECNLRSLKQLKLEMNPLCEAILIYVIFQKLDTDTRKSYEMELGSELPNWEKFTNFLNKRCQALENVNKGPGGNEYKREQFKTLIVNNEKNNCMLGCTEPHPIFKCQKFIHSNADERLKYVRKFNLCYNCLGFHKMSKCKKIHLKCKSCNKNHSTMLHGASFSLEKQNKTTDSFALQNEKIKIPQQMPDTGVPDGSQNESQIPSVLYSLNTNKNVLLSTVRVKVLRSNRKCVYLNALLDSGSMRNLITESAANLLGCQKSKCRADLVGLKNTVVPITEKICTRIFNDDESFSKDLEFLILPEISGNVPAEKINISDLNLPGNIKYANPNFHIPQKISLLLGGDVFYELLRGNQIRLKGNSIVLVETVFGWVVTGSIPAAHQNNSSCYFVQDRVDEELQRFWDLESLGILQGALADEEDKAMTLFKESVCYKEGRYEVRLPWKRDFRELNDNLTVARRRLDHLNRKFERCPGLYNDYHEILKEYEKEGIIELVPNNNVQSDKPLFYLPFSMVYRDSVTTKKRIVFDASAHAEGELSLNDCLYAGLNFNPFIFNMLIFFRLKAVAVLADVQKAFLQISLNEKDRDAVRFLFPSSNPGTREEKYEILIYRFCRVLFGVNASPFLLSATIKEHIGKFRELHPTIVEMLDNCIYVDDLIASLDNVLSAFKMSQEAKRIMAAAGMNLCKWSSNSKELVKKWEESGFNTHPIHSDINEPDKLLKVLGLPWNVQEDYLTIDVKDLLDFNNRETITKRIMLSTAGKLFDVLGLLTPFTIRLKWLLQELWLRKCSWDGELPTDLHRTYAQWRSELTDIPNLQLPRMILDTSTGDEHDLQIHVFSDASQKAYGTAIYLRVKYPDKISVNLIASKSRVAPLKKLTLPKLELMGALLAARLSKEVEKVIRRIGSPTVHFWTDSQITLFWIKGPHHKWKQFVSNRVKEIQTLSNPEAWSHVPGKLNIADIITRGVSVGSLLNNEAWWSGPKFLRNNEVSRFDCGNSVPEESYVSELKKGNSVEGDICFTVTNQSVCFLNDLLKCTNNFCKLIRIVSYVFRFIHNCKNPKDKKSGYLECKELNNSEFFLLKFTQSEYAEEIAALTKGENVNGKSKLSSLNCFLDKNGLIRVGGRITNSTLDDNTKHPIVLSPKHPLTYMIVQYFHLKYLHVGPQTLMYLIRQKYWPLNARNLCRQVIYNCVTCTKNKPKLEQQLMGQLPKERVEPSPPFSVTGIDFCGPFHVKFKGQRKGVLNKIYVAIYVCFCTKAIHLDFVSDLTSAGFIASLKRFFSRRGKASKIFTDNGRNFVGADAELRRLLKKVNTPDEKLAQYFIEEKIDWHYNPPKSPNFGGLYEAGVKSFKFHLKRIVGNSHFTLEEFITVLAEIEGVLNSRPLTPLSADFDNFETLTPGHFLIGRPITSIAEPQLTDIEENRLSRWERVSKYSQKIWTLWKRDYLNNLQERHKWQFSKNNVTVGTLVLVKEENLPGTKWLTGRIEEIFTGSDGRVRVVNVRLPKGNILKRSVRQICVLPVY